MGGVIFFAEMLGVEDAVVSMNENGMPEHVAARVLGSMTTMHTSDGAIVGDCQHDPDLAPIRAEMRNVPVGQEWAVARQSMDAASSSVSPSFRHLRAA